MEIDTTTEAQTPTGLVRWWMRKNGYLGYFTVFGSLYLADFGEMNERQRNNFSDIRIALDRAGMRDIQVMEAMERHERRHLWQVQLDGKVRWLARYYWQWAWGILKRLPWRGGLRDAVRRSYSEIDYEIDANTIGLIR